MVGFQTSDGQLCTTQSLKLSQGAQPLERAQEDGLPLDGVFSLETAFQWRDALCKYPSLSPIAPPGPDGRFFIARGLQGKLIGSSTTGNGKHQIHHLY